jgi:hypothetical protein
MTLEKLMDLEFELTKVYMENKTVDNWNKLVEIRELGTVMEMEAEYEIEIIGKEAINAQWDFLIDMD